MTVYRVTMEFDLEILDEEPAKELTAEHWRTTGQTLIDEGGRIETTHGESPEVAGHRMAQHSRAVASTVAFRFLAAGQAALPWAKISDVQVTNEPKTS